MITLPLNVAVALGSFVFTAGVFVGVVILTIALRVTRDKVIS